MQNEISNFYLAVLAIERNSLDARRKSEAIGQRHYFTINKDHVAGKTGLSNTDIVDLWLYTQFAHIQTKRTKKHRFIREDFDKYEAQVGKTELEFEFRNAIKLLGTHFLILYYESALPELIDWEQNRGIVLPFNPKNAFGSDGTDVYDSGVTIKRASHLLLQTEQPAYKLVRLLERQNFQSLKFFLSNILELRYADTNIEPYTAACDQITGHRDLPHLLVSLGYQEGFGDSGSAYSSQTFFDQVSYQRGSVHVYPCKRIEFVGDAKQILQRSYNDLRQEMESGKSSSTFLDVHKRLDKEIATRRTLKERTVQEQ